MTTKAVQVRFTAGQVDTSISSRIDQKSYYQGLEEAVNVRIGIQGIAIRRPGSKYLKKLDNRDVTNVRLIEFEPDSASSYLILLTKNNIDIYKYNKDNKTLGAEPVQPEYEEIVSGDLKPDPSELKTRAFLTNKFIPFIKTAQQANTLWFFNPNFPVSALVYDDTDSDNIEWKFKKVAFTDPPYFRFGESQEIAPTGSLTFEANQGPSVRATLGVLADISELEVNDVIISILGGRARIIEKNVENKNDVIKVRIEETIKFSSSSNSETPNLTLQQNEWKGRNGYEPSWSATRGYPTCGGFHQGRLWLLGTKSQSDQIWGSKVTTDENFYTIFTFFEDLADAGISAPIATKRPVQIRAMESKNSLQVFSNLGEYYIPSDVGNPITPTTITIKQATSHGISTQLDTIQAGNTTLFLEENGKVLRQFIYNEDLQTFDAPNITILSSDLINNPINAAYQTSTPKVQSHFVYLVNTTGDMAVCNYADDLKVYPWTKWETEGKYKDVAVFDTTLFTVVDRGGGRNFLEQFDEDCLLDCCDGDEVKEDQDPKNEWEDVANHLIGFDRSQVKVFADGYVDDGAIIPVDENNKVREGTTITTNPVEKIQVGLDFRVKMTTLPIELVVNESQTIGDKKSIISVNVGLFESQAVNITVNGTTYKPSVKSFGSNFFNQTVDNLIIRSGYQEQFVSGILRDAKVTITQDQPVQFGIKYLGVVIESGKQ